MIGRGFVSRPRASGCGSDGVVGTYRDEYRSKERKEQQEKQNTSTHVREESDDGVDSDDNNEVHTSLMDLYARALVHDDYNSIMTEETGAGQRHIDSRHCQRESE
mgnify:FL=1